jgi:hypothetical protein
MIRQKLALLACIIASAGAGCTTQPGRQDVEFMRGCWVEKSEPGGRVTAMLRLLPPAPDAIVYAGVLTRHAADGSTVGPTTQYSIWRDGSKLGVQLLAEGAQTGDIFLAPSPDYVATPISDADASALPPHDKLATFERGDAKILVFAGAKDALTILSRTKDGAALSVIFNGERDGCD